MLPMKDTVYASAERIASAGLISHQMSMEEPERGFEVMRDKTEEYGKVMEVVDGIEG